MPIDIETFESEVGDDPSHARRIVQFLAANDDEAFRRSEIAEAIDVDPNVASSVLSRLKERDLVRHKPPYWAIGEPDRVAQAVAFSRDLENLNERLGTENIDEWRKAGEDETGSNE